MAENNSPKTLGFSFDGTGNEPSAAGGFAENESITNILKLPILMGGGLGDDHSSTKTPVGNEQCVFQYNGIGTLEGGRRIPLLGSPYSAGHSMLNMVLAPTLGGCPAHPGRGAEGLQGGGLPRWRRSDHLRLQPRGAALARKFAAMILAECADCRVSFLGAFEAAAAMDGMHRKGGSRARLRRGADDFHPDAHESGRCQPQAYFLETRFPGVQGDIGKDEIKVVKCLEEHCWKMFAEASNHAGQPAD